MINTILVRPGNLHQGSLEGKQHSSLKCSDVSYKLLQPLLWVKSLMTALGYKEALTTADIKQQHQYGSSLLCDSEPPQRPKLLRKSIKKLEIASLWLLDCLTSLSIFRMAQTVETERMAFIFLMWLLCMPPQSSSHCGTLGTNINKFYSSYQYF